MSDRQRELCSIASSTGPGSSTWHRSAISRLLERLGSRLKFLTGGARDLPTRQQTIHNTIQWSYHLLDERAKILFARLGAFVGGCTLAAAEAVCNTDNALPLDVVDGIAALVDQSLLRQDERPGGTPRFVMLETIREYALERLEQRGELEAMRRWHAEYFLALAEEAEPELAGPRQVVWSSAMRAWRCSVQSATPTASASRSIAPLKQPMPPAITTAPRSYAGSVCMSITNWAIAEARASHLRS
ncbi:MAG TPA: hypothetical protein VFU22_27485 [Roseiflexaceae bacterium]|nr:hypothetical protein [Roseiflexaceae bacterium]